MQDNRPISDADLHQMQNVMLNILATFDAICREYNITYYLSGGTMLGAVRHQGFIPWDDDVDVVVPRTDYEKLLAHAKEWLPNFYELINPAEYPDYPYQFARIQDNRTTYLMVRQFDFVGGVPLDVFPLDDMPKKGLLRRWHFMKIRFYTKLLYYALINPNKHGRGLYSLFIKIMHKIVPLNKVHAKLDKIQKEFLGKGMPCVTNHFNTKDSNVFQRDVYGIPQRMKFETIEVNGMQRPHDYLFSSYGDYMTLPKKLPGLNFRYLDLNTPYKNFVSKRM